MGKGIADDQYFEAAGCDVPETAKSVLCLGSADLVQCAGLGLFYQRFLIMLGGLPAQLRIQGNGPDSPARVTFKKWNAVPDEVDRTNDHLTQTEEHSDEYEDHCA